MKKLKLRLVNSEGIEILTREQLRRVNGGDTGSGSPCTAADEEACILQGKYFNADTCKCTDQQFGCKSDDDCGLSERCLVNEIGWGSCVPW